MEKYLKLFAAISDETRLRIYLLLSKGELCVCELTAALDMEQSRISHSLRILKEAGLIESRREGKWVIYFAEPDMIKSKIIQGLTREIPPGAADLKNLTACKKGNLRKRCGLKK